MASISFIHPQYLLFLLVIPVFIFIHIATLRSTKNIALKFANFEAIARIKGVDFFSKNIVITLLSIFIVFLLVMAVSGLTLHTTINASSYSFVIAIDTSESMGADDILPNRLEAAKEAAVSFVEALPITTRAGVISFSGNALIEQDLTESKTAIKNALQGIVISEISGTDLQEAVITGTNLLNAEESKAIIILSDGQINVGNLDDAVNYANEHNVVIHTIAFGTAEGGKTSFGLSKVDEDSLKALSYNTQGESFRALDKEELFNSFNKAIKETKRKVAIDLSIYLLIASIILFSVEYFLISSRYRRLV